MNMVKREVFEQLPRESSKAFAAFKTYLDLGPDRSLARTASQVGKSKRLMEEWSRRFDWPGRVASFAAHVAELERQAIEARAVARAVEWDKMTEPVRREAWLKSEEVLKLTDDFLERWRNTTRIPGFESVVRGIELAIRLKQIAAGMPSEIKEVNATLKATVDVEWEVALRKAYGPKPAVVDVEEVGQAKIGGPGKENKQ